MIKRLEIKNYKCFGNFVIEFDDVNLLMGLNGTGKSTVLEVLEKITAVR